MVDVIHTGSFIPTVQGSREAAGRIKDMSRCIVTYLESLGSPGGGRGTYKSLTMQKLGVEVIPHTISRGPIAVEKPPPASSAQPSRLHYLLDGLSVAKICAFHYRQKQVDAVLSWGHDAPLSLGF